jgi:hypothetical protein
MTLTPPLQRFDKVDERLWSMIAYPRPACTKESFMGKKGKIVKNLTKKEFMVYYKQTSGGSVGKGR